jgi:predicted AlkP superfamily phosphohydrolase/phosphomutase
MIGLDAAELSFVREHAASLPVLARLLTGPGTSAKPLASTASRLAGSVWPTFYTGAGPGEHGIYHHLQWDAAAMRLRRVTDKWLWAEPFWYELERQGKSVIAVDVPMTFPSRLRRGVEVINWGSHDTLSATSARPEPIARQIRKRFGKHPMGCEIPVDKTLAELERIRASLVAGARRKGELSRWLAESQPWDFFLTVFGETHRGGHILWPGADAPGEVAVPTTALLDVYRAVDDAVGHLLDSPAMKGATVVLFALHGMGPNISQEHFVPKVVDRINAEFARTAGAAHAASNDNDHHDGNDNDNDNALQAPPAAHGQRSLMRTLREKLPPGLQNAIARAVPVSVRDFVVSRSVTGGHDWRSTPGLALLADLHGYFRFNLRGREAAGSLDPGGEALRRYRDTVERGFAELTVPATGAPLVKDLMWTADGFPGARQKYLPDLIISWNVASQAEEAHSEHLGTIRSRAATGRSGNHRPHGFCAVAAADENEIDLTPVNHISHLSGFAKTLLNPAPSK